MFESELLSQYSHVWAGTRDGDAVHHVKPGRKPALIVVDLAAGFTDVDGPLGFDLAAQIEFTNLLLASARGAGVPAIFSTVSYDAESTVADVWLEKVPEGRSLVNGSPGAAIDPRLDREPDDRIVVKTHASCFFGTDLASHLHTAGIDTVVIAGATTSGCVRATAVDACSCGFKTLVVEEAVGDRDPLQHIANLIDIHTKYGDVVDVTAAAEYLSCIV